MARFTGSAFGSDWLKLSFLDLLRLLVGRRIVIDALNIVGPFGKIPRGTTRHLGSEG